MKNNVGGTVEGAITADGIYKMVKYYAKRVRVLAADYGRDQRPRPEADMVGHVNIATTRLYDRRKTRPEVRY